MNHSHCVSAWASLIVSAICATSASATMLFETTPDLTEPTAAPFTDTISGAGQFYGSSFVLDTDAYVTGLSWMGVNTGDMNKVTSFTLEIWSDGLLYDFYHVPNQQLLSVTVPLAETSMIDTGHQIYGLPVYNFSTALDIPLEVQGGENYWLVLYGNSTPGSMFAWLQAENRSDSWAATYSIQSGVGPQWGSASRESTFTIIGNAIPEPTTATMLLLGGAVVLYRPRRRKI